MENIIQCLICVDHAIRVMMIVIDADDIIMVIVIMMIMKDHLDMIAVGVVETIVNADANVLRITLKMIIHRWKTRN